MSVIATVSIRAEDFTLDTTLSSTSSTQVRLERVVPVGESFIPYLWASNEAVDDLEVELEQDPDVASFDVVDCAGEQVLVRIEWAEAVDGFLNVLSRTDATILEGNGEADRWWFQIRFADHDRLTAFYQRCAEKDIGLDLESLHNPRTPRDPGVDLDLTETQRTTLLFALERGYFEVPRRTNVVELADELGISDSAVSQRLRRATERLLSAVLVEHPDEK